MLVVHVLYRYLISASRKICVDGRPQFKYGLAFIINTNRAAVARDVVFSSVQYRTISYCNCDLD